MSLLIGIIASCEVVSVIWRPTETTFLVLAVAKSGPELNIQLRPSTKPKLFGDPKQ